jgi:hypothetical protein
VYNSLPPIGANNVSHSLNKIPGGLGTRFKAPSPTDSDSLGHLDPDTLSGIFRRNEAPNRSSDPDTSCLGIAPAPASHQLTRQWICTGHSAGHILPCVWHRYQRSLE